MGQAIALRDLVKASVALGLLDGIYLLLDELEKHTAKPEKQIVVSYLQGLRAFIDALPERLFLVLSMTPEARVRYFVLVPALASRLQTTVKILPLRSEREGIDLAEFYVTEARAKAAQDPTLKGKQAGIQPILEDVEVSTIFASLHQRAERIGEAGVTQRSFLDGLRVAAQARFEELS